MKSFSTISCKIEEKILKFKHAFYFSKKDIITFKALYLYARNYNNFKLLILTFMLKRTRRLLLFLYDLHFA